MIRPRRTARPCRPNLCRPVPGSRGNWRTKGHWPPACCGRRRSESAASRRRSGFQARCNPALRVRSPKPAHVGRPKGRRSRRAVSAPITREFGAGQLVGEFGRARDLILDDVTRRHEGVTDGQRLGPGHDAPMRETAPDSKQDHVAGVGPVDEARALKEEAKVAFLIAVHHPIGGVGPRVEVLDQRQVAIDAHEQHRAVDADPLDVRHVMIGRADPGARSRDDGAARQCRFSPPPRRSKKATWSFNRPSAAAGRRGSRGSSRDC